jgi:hypothetical protein
LAVKLVIDGTVNYGDSVLIGAGMSRCGSASGAQYGALAGDTLSVGWGPDDMHAPDTTVVSIDLMGAKKGGVLARSTSSALRDTRAMCSARAAHGALQN